MLMPLKVCNNCVYYRLNNSCCISGLNVVSKRFAKAGDVKAFSNRAKGPFCSNNLYLASLVIPIIAMIPALILKFSFFSTNHIADHNCIACISFLRYLSQDCMCSLPG